MDAAAGTWSTVGAEGGSVQPRLCAVDRDGSAGAVRSSRPVPGAQMPYGLCSMAALRRLPAGVPFKDP